jgi:hypothetical protein
MSGLFVFKQIACLCQLIRHLKEWATDWQFDSHLMRWGVCLGHVRRMHEIFTRGKNRQTVKLTTHIHIIAKIEGACALATRPPTRLHGALHSFNLPL